MAPPYPRDLMELGTPDMKVNHLVDELLGILREQVSEGMPKSAAIPSKSRICFPMAILLQSNRVASGRLVAIVACGSPAGDLLEFETRWVWGAQSKEKGGRWKPDSVNSSRAKEGYDDAELGRNRWIFAAGARIEMWRFA